MLTNWNLFKLPRILLFGATVLYQRPSLMSLQAVSPEPLRFFWPAFGYESLFMVKPHISCPSPMASLGSLGCSGSCPLLLIVTYWIDLLSRVFRNKTKWGSHGWPRAAFPFNSVIKLCWLAGLVSTVYKKVLCKQSHFSHRPVWHQRWDDLLLESLIAQLYHCSLWVSLATSLSYTEPKIPHWAGGKSVCRWVFLINDFWMVVVFSPQMSLSGTDGWEMWRAPFA